jgi:hypothetical protein
MKRAVKFAVSFVGGALCLNSVLAANAVLPGNPYTIVVERNIFGLNPPPVVDPNAVVVEPPVKIIPNGIMTILGQLQVLFKVTAKPGSKDKDASYILTEGQRQDDIEVTKINESKGIITFNNHGIVQELALVATPASSAAAPGTAGGPPGGSPGAHVPQIASGSTAGSSPFSQHSRTGTSSGGDGGNSSPTLGNGSSPSPTLVQQPSSGLTEEGQTVAIEVNRELTKDQVSNGDMPPLPPTPMTPDDATGLGGGPLITPKPSANPR